MPDEGSEESSAKMVSSKVEVPGAQVYLPQQNEFSIEQESKSGVEADLSAGPADPLEKQ